MNTQRLCDGLMDVVRPPYIVCGTKHRRVRSTLPYEVVFVCAWRACLLDFGPAWLQCYNLNRIVVGFYIVSAYVAYTQVRSDQRRFRDRID
jgi:hypothetical protein